MPFCRFLCCGLAAAMLAINGIQIPCRGWIVALRLALLLRVDRGDVGGGFCMRSHQASLFSVTYEVFEILYCTHGREMSNGEYRKKGNNKARERGVQGEVGCMQKRKGPKELDKVQGTVHCGINE